MHILESRTEQVKMGDSLRYATLHLPAKDAPLLKNEEKEATLPNLRSTERRLAKNLAKAQVYEDEIQKLIKESTAEIKALQHPVAGMIAVTVPLPVRTEIRSDSADETFSVRS
ncbi:hypothetical protein SKAU_G00387770 [Synaphobranchus kaupii]|uniref:Uncharacterized protein n=1 Tax=Synaphobranchus kaupii TaxID=118154 RepID=A0A9Q1EAZ9_SYNKA|nr:hypothetical protein SKAU_G00387770 [Synaphobranchus kaupii]